MIRSLFCVAALFGATSALTAGELDGVKPATKTEKAAVTVVAPASELDKESPAAAHRRGGWGYGGGYRGAYYGGYRGGYYGGFGGGYYGGFGGGYSSYYGGGFGGYGGGYSSYYGGGFGYQSYYQPSFVTYSSYYPVYNSCW